MLGSSPPRTKLSWKHFLDSVPRTAFSFTGFSLHTLWFGLWISFLTALLKASPTVLGVPMDDTMY